MKFTDGLTVKQLKELIKDWPETSTDGEDTEVWIQTGTHTSQHVTEVDKLNVTTTGYDISLS